MLKKSLCTGCPVFTMCLGDLDGFLEKGPLRRCNHCGEHFIRRTWFPDKTFCEEFYDIVKSYHPGPTRHTTLEKYAVCHHATCQKMLQKLKDDDPLWAPLMDKTET